MNVSWYPGHMTKAKRMMAEDIKIIDLVIELLDARIPISSRNPDIDELAKGKSRLVILNKSDLADPASNEQWVRYFSEKGLVTVLIDSKNRKGFSAISRSIDEACKAKLERDKKRGIIGRPVRAMVVGIPNVGKSTFINSLCKRASTKTGNKPGVTKGKQWIKLNKGVELLDTPGILWPKFENETIGQNLAFIGSINDEILDEVELSLNLIDVIRKLLPGALTKRFGTGEEGSSHDILGDIAVKRGSIRAGGEADYDKAARVVLTDFRAGLLGNITLEIP